MDDLISRQAAIDALYDWSEHSMTDAEAWHIKQVIGDIKSLPSVQPERKKGRWFWTDGMYACDQCHAVLDEMSPFCPMCGADMRGEDA